MLHGLYDFGSFLFEVTEFPVLPDNPSNADYTLLITPLATMILVTAVGLVELVWSGQHTVPAAKDIGRAIVSGAFASCTERGERIRSK